MAKQPHRIHRIIGDGLRRGLTKARANDRALAVYNQTLCTIKGMEEKPLDKVPTYDPKQDVKASAQPAEAEGESEGEEGEDEESDGEDKGGSPGAAPKTQKAKAADFI